MNSTIAFFAGFIGANIIFFIVYAVYSFVEYIRFRHYVKKSLRTSAKYWKKYIEFVDTTSKRLLKIKHQDKTLDSVSDYDYLNEFFFGV